MSEVKNGSILGLFAGECGGENKEGPAHTPKAEETGGNESVPAAGAQQTSEREERFRALMEGEYKDLFTAYFQETFNRRFKEHKTVKAEWERMRPLYTALSERYGITDSEALLAAIRAEKTSDTAPTATAEPALPLSRDPAAALPNTSDLLPQTSVPKDKIPPETGAKSAPVPPPPPDLEAVRAAARRELLETIRARGLRPAENALGHATLGGGDLRLTREEREELARRAAKGEHITL